VSAVWKSVWRLIKKQKTLKIAPLKHPAISLLGIKSNECKSTYKSNICTPMFIEALFTIAKLWTYVVCKRMDRIVDCCDK
jgi:hypothetical protein